MESESLDPRITEFGQAIALLVRRLRATGEPADLSWTQTGVMARLDRDGPMTTADLARAEGVKPQSMGAIVAALEEMGIVERKPHPTDGRQMNIQLTADGLTRRRSDRAARWVWLSETISKLDETEKKTLFEAGEIIRRVVGS